MDAVGQRLAGFLIPVCHSFICIRECQPAVRPQPMRKAGRILFVCAFVKRLNERKVQCAHALAEDAHAAVHKIRIIRTGAA